MANDFLILIQLMAFLTPIIADAGLLTKIPNVIVRSRHQLLSICKYLSRNPVLFDNRRSLDDLPEALAYRSGEAVFFCLNSYRNLDNLNKFLEVTFASRDIHALPMVFSFGTITDPIARDLFTVILDESDQIDIASFRGLDMDCIPSYKSICRIIDTLNSDGIKQESVFMDISLRVLREYYREQGMSEDKSTELVDMLYRKYGSSLSSDLYFDCCDTFISLYNRWARIHGRVIDLSTPLSRDPRDIQNAIFDDGRSVYLSKSVLDSIIWPLLSDTRRGDVLSSLSMRRILIPKKKEEFVSHMTYHRDGANRIATMYCFDKSRLDEMM